MTINPASVSTSAYDLLDGSVSSFYAQVDEAIVPSEVVKGQYRMTINPAYNAPNPVDSNSFTTVGLTQSGPMVVDLCNSYITTEVDVDLNMLSPITQANATKTAGAFFIGWKSSIEAVERYDIMVNSTPIYTQSFTGEESFIQYQVINDLVKNTSPYIYTTYENASQMSPNVCGTYVIWKGAAEAQTWSKIKIPIKIPIRNFLILRNLKYLLSWMGKWEIRLYFSTQNMIYLPIKNSVFQRVIGSTKYNELCAGVLDSNDSALTHNFTQIGMSCMWYADGYTTVDTKDYLAPEPNTLQATKMTLNNVEMNTAQFQIRMDIMEMLKQKYMSEKPLTFPVNTIQIARFTGPPQDPGTGGASSSLSIVLCQAINNCDTMFVLPFRNTLQHTVCTNPYVQDIQLHAGEYGSYPTQPFSTYGTKDFQNIRFVNSVADSLNVNGSELTSFSRDICRTFVTDPFIQDGTNTLGYYGTNGEFGDRTNFFIPFPFSTDDDFQGGLSSPSSNINFKLTGSILTRNGVSSQPDASVRDDSSFSTPWVACFLIDGVIMIRPDPGSDAAKVIWSDRTVC